MSSLVWPPDNLVAFSLHTIIREHPKSQCLFTALAGALMSPLACLAVNQIVINGQRPATAKR
ncbi:hypothetical protein Lepto7375DRAFT_0043 [Leptolyngbya sp. PCC 7375]|nr:hypothetical protein Lepto7375DRAFT_0043 [Leptolyngbya sp. PCC 7375]